MASDTPVITINGLSAGYGQLDVVHDVSLALHLGETVALLGRNGAGKSTTLKAIMGILGRRAGSIVCNGTELITLPGHKVAGLGIAYCPEDRGIFSTLSVEENLTLPRIVSLDGMTTDQIYELFPNLHARRHSRGSQLSGGEQQMLAIGRMLRTGARILLLDEPTEGLAPIIVDQIAAVIRRLKTENYTILLVEQNLEFVEDLADRHYVMETGYIVEHLSAAEVKSSGDRIRALLGV